MPTRDNPRLRYDEEKGRLKEAVEQGKIASGTAERITDSLDARDPEDLSTSFSRGGEKIEFTSNTLRTYAMRLRLVATEISRPLVDLGDEDVDDLIQALLEGSSSLGPSDGYAKGTLSQYECALIAHYRYHDGHDVDPEEIDVHTSDDSSIDERDLWTVDEIEAMRDVLDSKRNEALFEFLAYTGQRIRVVQTLRVGDIEPESGRTGRYYVNQEVEGRKNREGHGPLLGARGPVQRWLQIHPTGNDDDAFITCPPKRTGGATPGERITQQSIRDVLERIRDRAGIDKEVHPHMFRHYFSTIAKKPKSRGGFGMDSDYIKRLRGDAPGSTVFETTYSHIVDEDASEHAEVQFSGEEPGNALVPRAPCGVCGEMLQAGDAACSNCGAVRSPDAEKSEVERLQERVDELEAERQVQREAGAAEALAGGADLSEDEMEEIANDDVLLSKLIRVRQDLATE